MEEHASNNNMPETSESPVTDPPVAGSMDAAAEPSVAENNREADLRKAQADEAAWLEVGN